MKKADIARPDALTVCWQPSCWLFAPAGSAQAAWPEKPIKIVLPFGAGGVADVTRAHHGRQARPRNSASGW